MATRARPSPRRSKPAARPSKPARRASPAAEHDAAAALLADIVAHPADDGPRAVYADWLTERQDPRGELVALQCALAVAPPDDPAIHRMRHREKALLDAHAAAWTAPLRALGERLSFTFRRGFVEEVAGDVESLAQAAARLVALAPLADTFAVYVTRRTIAPFVGSPLLARTRALTLRSGKARIELGSLATVASALPLVSLVCDETALGREDLELLATARVLPALRHLTLTGTRVGKGGVAALGALETPLETLVMQTMHAPADVVRTISTAPGLARLETLGLANNPIGDAGLATLLAGGRLRAVRHLDLRSNALSRAALHRLLEAELGPVRQLLLGGNELDDEVVAAIARWPGAERLDRLDLGSTNVTDAGARALAASPRLAGLRSLVLSNARCTAAGCDALLGSPHLQRARLYVGSRFLKRG